VAEPDVEVPVPVVPEPAIDTSDLSVLVRAYHGPQEPPVEVPTAVKSAQLTIMRNERRDFPDRQILTFLDGEPMGKVRYGETLTREVAPGTHSVRAFNTLNYKIFESEANRPDPKLAVPIAGDDPEAVQVAAGLVRDAGFDPVVVGKLADAKRFQRGTSGYGQNVTAAELRQKLSLMP